MSGFGSRLPRVSVAVSADFWETWPKTPTNIASKVAAIHTNRGVNILVSKAFGATLL